jgi:hypothetical protein
MKNFKYLMILILSICFVIGIVSIGWSVERVIKPEAATGVIQPAPVPHCPTGFTMAADGSRCDRTKPANPCAQGFHVEWGTCITGSGLGAQDPYPCGYKCIPNAPAAGSYLLKCPAKTGPPIIAGPCQIRCTDILY